MQVSIHGHHAAATSFEPGGRLRSPSKIRHTDRQGAELHIDVIARAPTTCAFAPICKDFASNVVPEVAHCRRLSQLAHRTALKLHAQGGD